MRNNEQGRSMIEMLGVLAIVGVLSVGGIAGYSKAMNKFKTNKIIDQINMVSTNIRTLYSSQRNYEGLNNSVAIGAGIIPGEMYDADASGSAKSKITNAFNGEMWVQAGNTDAGDNKAFIVAVDSVPASSCTTIATTDWGSDAGSGLLAMGIINNVTAEDLAGSMVSDVQPSDSFASMAHSAYGFPYKMSSASVACGREGFAAIAWKYE